MKASVLALRMIIESKDGYNFIVHLRNATEMKWDCMNSPTVFLVAGLDAADQL